MSICDFGMDCKVSAQELTIQIDKNHPLMLLASFLPWVEMFTLILSDLKITAKGQWWRGRKLKVRIHLGAYILQQLYNHTDRETEYAIRDNAACQLFCGRAFMDKWHAPDHTKIEDFRSRLTSETQRQLTNMIAVSASKSGLADPSEFDIDSTVQEANMTYPTDAKMLRKLGSIIAKVMDSLKRIAPRKYAELSINIKSIATKARACFFQKKYTPNEERTKNLQKLLSAVKLPLKKAIAACNALTPQQSKKLNWSEQRSKKQMVDQGEDYLQSVEHYINTGCAVEGKRLSFHLNEVECFSKGKAGKKYEFGRAFQLGRIGGNFMIVSECTSVRMDDKKSFAPMIQEHQALFGEHKIDSISTDKGYYTHANVKKSQAAQIQKIGIQEPSNIKNKVHQISAIEREELNNRRAGIEPLIGHIKQGGQLGRSRMKSDETIKASGYASVLGFNLRQVIRVKFKQLDEAMAMVA
jgi:hypothetical protein